MDERRYKSMSKRWREDMFGKPAPKKLKFRKVKYDTFIAIDINGNPVANFNTEEEVKEYIRDNGDVATRYERVSIGYDTTYINSNAIRNSIL